VKFVNIPHNKVVVNAQNKAIILNIKGNGLKLLSYKFGWKMSPLIVDISNLKVLLRKNKPVYYVPTNSIVQKIAKQLDNKIELINIYPDTIFYELDDLFYKKVPVKANILLSFEKQYKLYEPIKLSPESIIVAGAKNVIDKINSVTTDTLLLTNLKNNVYSSLNIKKIKVNQQIEYIPQKVNINIVVEKFTESSIEVPVTMINIPDEYNMKIFPAKVKLNYQIAFRDYKKVNESQFLVVADYATLNNKNTNTIELKVLKYPSVVKFLTLNGNKVEFILIKK
jgi:hypothetical protein